MTYENFDNAYRNLCVLDGFIFFPIWMIWLTKSQKNGKSAKTALVLGGLFYLATGFYSGYLMILAQEGWKYKISVFYLRYDLVCAFSFIMCCLAGIILLHDFYLKTFPKVDNQSYNRKE